VQQPAAHFIHSRPRQSGAHYLRARTENVHIGPLALQVRPGRSNDPMTLATLISLCCLSRMFRQICQYRRTSSGFTATGARDSAAIRFFRSAKNWSVAAGCERPHGGCLHLPVLRASVRPPTRQRMRPARVAIGKFRESLPVPDPRLVE